MSFFARATNLLKGSFKTLGRGSAEDDRRLRALEEELARAERVEKRVEPDRVRDEPPRAVPEPIPPERDALGNVKRTL